MLLSTHALLSQFTFTRQETTTDFEFTDGISLLSLKHQLLLSYMQSLVLLHSHRILGYSLTTRSPPSEPFNSPERGKRGAGAGDLVDSMIESRIVLEKTKLLESKMRYQIEKLVQLVAGDPSDDKLVNGLPALSRGICQCLYLIQRSARISSKPRSACGRWSR